MSETDHILKRLVASAPLDFAAWVLGSQVRGMSSRNIELTADPEPVDTDQVFFVELVDNREVIFHMEFQGPGSHKPMPLRELDYICRLVLTYRNMLIVSVVFYLGGAGATDTGQHQIRSPDGGITLAWNYHVIHLWQIDAESLLAMDRPALLALIGQTRMDQPASVLPRAIEQIGTRTSGELRDRLFTELILLCSDEEIAKMAEQLIEREYGLPDTPMVRRLRAEGRAEGHEEGWERGIEYGLERGLTQGRETERQQMIIRLVQQRVGALDVATQEQIRRLSAARVYELLDAVFGLESVADLHAWLAAHAEPDTEQQ